MRSKGWSRHRRFAQAGPKQAPMVLITIHYRHQPTLEGGQGERLLSCEAPEGILRRLPVRTRSRGKALATPGTPGVPMAGRSTGTMVERWRADGRGKARRPLRGQSEDPVEGADAALRRSFRRHPQRFLGSHFGSSPDGPPKRPSSETCLEAGRPNTCTLLGGHSDGHTCRHHVSTHTRIAHAVAGWLAGRPHSPWQARSPRGAPLEGTEGGKNMTVCKAPSLSLVHAKLHITDRQANGRAPRYLEKIPGEDHMGSCAEGSR
jgi:hypothetical protein